MKLRQWTTALVVGITLIGGGCGGPADLSTPSIRVPNRTLSKDNVFTIGSVVATAPGWVVIMNQINGDPGEVLGYAPVVVGENKDITIKINRDDATAQQFVFLYKDAGKIGEFEYEEPKTGFHDVINEEQVLAKDGKPVQVLFLAEVE